MRQLMHDGPHWCSVNEADICTRCSLEPHTSHAPNRVDKLVRVLLQRCCNPLDSSSTFNDLLRSERNAGADYSPSSPHRQRECVWFGVPSASAANRPPTTRPVTHSRHQYFYDLNPLRAWVLRARLTWVLHGSLVCCFAWQKETKQRLPHAHMWTIATRLTENLTPRKRASCCTPSVRSHQPEQSQRCTSPEWELFSRGFH